MLPKFYINFSPILANCFQLFCNVVTSKVLKTHFPYTVAVASLTGTQILFAFPRGEVMPMFVTWELLFLLAGFIIALLTYIDNHNKKN